MTDGTTLTHGAVSSGGSDLPKHPENEKANNNQLSCDR
jgi:hypothetical protein